MQKTTAPNSSAGAYVDEVPGTVVGTTDQAADKNMTQNELCNAVVGIGTPLTGLALTSSYADQTQVYQTICKLAIECGKPVGELFWELDYSAPVAFNTAQPRTYRPYLCIDNVAEPLGTPITITDAHWPLLGPYLRAFKTNYRDGTGSQQSQWSATTGICNSNIVCLTLAANAGETALCKVLAEDELVHGQWTTWLTVTVVSQFTIGAITINAGTYSIVADATNNGGLGVDPVARKISFSYTAANQGSTACTGTLEIHPFSIAGSLNTAQLLSGAGRTLMSPNDANDECFPGLRRRDRMQGHYHNLRANNSGNSTPPYPVLSGDNSATNLSGATTQEPITDGTNGTPNTGKTTDPRTITAHLYIHGGSYLP